MSQTYASMLSKVQEFHDKHEFSNEKNNGHDMAYRILLTIEDHCWNTVIVRRAFPRLGFPANPGKRWGGGGVR